MQCLHSSTDHPIITAAFAHYKLVTIHPFVDGLSDEALLVHRSFNEGGAKSGNGRTSRLLMNLLLLQNGYPLAIIKNEKRAAYIKAIQLARDTSDYNNFFMLVLDAVESSLDIYLQAIVQSI